MQLGIPENKQNRLSQNIPVSCRMNYLSEAQYAGVLSMGMCSNKTLNGMKLLTANTRVTLGTVPILWSFCCMSQ